MREQKIIKNKKIIIFSIIIVIVALILVIILSISKKIIENNNNDIDDFEITTNNASIIANSTTSVIKSGDESVAVFISKLNESDITYNSESGDIYNITPSLIKENSNYQIFKSSETGETFLMTDETIFLLGNSRDGNGVISFALADLDNDKHGELYFSYTWEPLRYRTNFGYYDSSKKEIIYFDDYIIYDQDAILVKNQDSLTIATASISSYSDKTNIKYNFNKALATIEFAGKIKIFEK